MRRFSFRPALTLRGRTFKGLRGWAGKPLHPPLTDIPVGAYMLAATFDLISFVAGDDQPWARDFYSRGFVHAHRWRGRVGARRADRLLGLEAIHRERHPGATNGERSCVDDDHRHRLVIAGIAVRALVFWDEQATPALALVLSTGRRGAHRSRRHHRRHARLRLRLQRRKRRRSPGVASLGDRCVARRPARRDRSDLVGSGRRDVAPKIRSAGGDSHRTGCGFRV